MGAASLNGRAASFRADVCPSIAAVAGKDRASAADASRRAAIEAAITFYSRASGTDSATAAKKTSRAGDRARAPR